MNFMENALYKCIIIIIIIIRKCGETVVPLAPFTLMMFAVPGHGDWLCRQFGNGMMYLAIYEIVWVVWFRYTNGKVWGCCFIIFYH